MDITLLAIVSITVLATALLFFFIYRPRPFPRLMERLPSDTSLLHIDQCVKETGHIWFFWSYFKQETPLLTLSLNVPRPVSPEDEQGLDDAVRRILSSLEASPMAPVRCEWQVMGGPLAWRLYLEFDWETVEAERLARMQEELLEAFRRHHAEDVRRCFRGSGDRNIYYTEQIGNTVERSLDMESAFDIRKYTFKSEGLLEYKADNENPVTAEEFDELFDAAKPDIDIHGLTVKKIRSYIRDLYLDEVILNTPVLRGGRPGKRRLEAWFRDRDGIWQNWNIVPSDGMWWVYSVEKGELADIYEMTGEEEACDLFVRYVVEGLQNAEDDER